MSDIAIKVENLSKQYRLGEIGTGTLVADLDRWWHKIRGKEDPYLKIGDTNDRTKKGESEYVWALKDINFEVKKGEVLGIIGRNGAGKSTLLKVLSSTTSPTKGHIKINGKIASLLEVGTGFHPDLSGRDNIFLNGAILGMNKKEIKSKFDEIVDFAGVERYIDTPVKRYSSGMYVRLAFGVAAHLEPDILIVDEVLAVGDSEFQKKCLGKMKEVSVNQGRTVLFVSHQMGSIAQLCQNALILKHGELGKIGPVKDVIDDYLKNSTNSSDTFYENPNPKGKKTFIKTARAVNINLNICESFSFEEEIYLKTEICLGQNERNVLLSATIQDRIGHFISSEVLTLLGSNQNDEFYKLLIKFPKATFSPGNYCFRLALFKLDGTLFDLIEQICPIQILETGSKMAPYEGLGYGDVLLDIKFEYL